MSVKFLLSSNLNGKKRISIMKEYLDKMTDEDWLELKKHNVHVCMIDSTELNIKAPLISIEEIDSNIKDYIKKLESLGEVSEDVLQFL